MNIRIATLAFLLAIFPKDIASMQRIRNLVKDALYVTADLYEDFHEERSILKTPTDTIYVGMDLTKEYVLGFALKVRKFYRLCPLLAVLPEFDRQLGRVKIRIGNPYATSLEPIMPRDRLNLFFFNIIPSNYLRKARFVHGSTVVLASPPGSPPHSPGGYSSPTNHAPVMGYPIDMVQPPAPGEPVVMGYPVSPGEHTNPPHHDPPHQSGYASSPSRHPYDQSGNTSPDRYHPHGQSGNTSPERYHPHDHSGHTGSSSYQTYPQSGYTSPSSYQPYPQSGYTSHSSYQPYHESGHTGHSSYQSYQDSGHTGHSSYQPYQDSGHTIPAYYDPNYQTGSTSPSNYHPPPPSGDVPNYFPYHGAQNSFDALQNLFRFP